MDKAIIAIFLAFCLFSCKEECSPAVSFDSTEGYFDSVSQRKYVRAVSSDSFQDEFEIEFEKGTNSSGPECAQEISAERKISYRASLSYAWFWFEITGKNEDERTCHLGFGNMNESDFWSFRTSAPYTLYAYSSPFSDRIRYIPDTLIDGINYKENYLISPPFGDLTSMLVNKHFGLLESSSENGFHWYFKP